jgi:hypothetical protein
VYLGKLTWSQEDQAKGERKIVCNDWKYVDKVGGVAAETTPVN